MRYIVSPACFSCWRPWVQELHLLLCRTVPRTPTLILFALVPTFAAAVALAWCTTLPAQTQPRPARSRLSQSTSQAVNKLPTLRPLEGSSRQWPGSPAGPAQPRTAWLATAQQMVSAARIFERISNSIILCVPARPGRNPKFMRWEVGGSVLEVAVLAVARFVLVAAGYNSTAN